MSSYLNLVVPEQRYSAFALESVLTALQAVTKKLLVIGTTYRLLLRQFGFSADRWRVRGGGSLVRVDVHGGRCWTGTRSFGERVIGWMSKEFGDVLIGWSSDKHGVMEEDLIWSFEFGFVVKRGISGLCAFIAITVGVGIDNEFGISIWFSGLLLGNDQRRVFVGV